MPETRLLVRAGRLIAAHDEPPIFDGAVVISGNVVESVGSSHELLRRYPDARQIGGERFLMIPGLINGHSHGKGLSDFQRGAKDNTLESWILSTRKHIPLPVADDIGFSAARLLKSGVTTTMHNHVPQNSEGYRREFEEAIEAYRDSGIRVQFNPGIRNENPFVYGDNEAFLRGLSEKARKVLTAPPPPGALTGEGFVKAVSELHSRHDSSACRIGFGPMAPQWCTRTLLLDVKRASDNLGVPIHIHAVQSIFQKVYGARFLGKSLIEYMKEIGFLGHRVVIGHCVWPTRRDMDLLAETDTGVTHHASCNLRVRNGISPVFEMLKAGVRVGLGIDSKSINDDDDIVQEMKVCFLLHRIPSLDLDSPHLRAREVFRMVTETNASLLGYGRELGRLEPGRLADLVLLDYEEMCFPFVDSVHDPVEVLLYRGKASHVRMVMVDGRIVVQDGRVLTVDEEAIGKRLAEAASRPRTEKEKELAEAIDELRRHVVRYYQGWPEEAGVKPYFAVNSME